MNDIVEFLRELPLSNKPRQVFVNQNVPKAVVDQLKEQGWVVVDVRLIDDHAQRIQGTLTGLNFGSITTNFDLKTLELEAKIYGLLRQKDPIQEATEAPSVVSDDDWMQILNIGGKDWKEVLPDVVVRNRRREDDD